MSWGNPALIKMSKNVAGLLGLVKVIFLLLDYFYTITL